MQFVTVTANAALDTAYLLDRFERGAINRVGAVRVAPGGKGNNVARVLARLGCAVAATGFAGGRTGRRIEEGLRQRGVEPAFVPIPGESRVCLTMVERETGTVTEVREPGEPVAAAAAGRLVERVGALAAGAAAVAVCGSLPPGVAPDFYATLLGAAWSGPALLALDASGDALRLGLAGGPDLIAPNRAEMAELMGRDGGLEEMIAFARHDLIGGALPAAGRVLLKLGAEGAVLIGRPGAMRAIPPTVAARNTVGCGDALLAAFLRASVHTDDAAEALAEAVAVGTAAALTDGVAEVDPSEVARLRPAVAVEVVAGTPPGGGVSR